MTEEINFDSGEIRGRPPKKTGEYSVFTKYAIQCNQLRSIVVDKKQEMVSCTIITTEPGRDLKHIHSRMPAILTKDNMNKWIDGKHTQNNAIKALKPYGRPLDYYPVSTFVNSPLNNSKNCIEPLNMEGE